MGFRSCGGRRPAHAAARPAGNQDQGQAAHSNYSDQAEGVEKTHQARLALDAQTIDQVAPGEQQPESDHGFKGEGAENGVAPAGRWRHARQWFSYLLDDPKAEARTLRLSFAAGDAGRRFDLFVNGQLIAEIELARPDAAGDIYMRDFPLPPALVSAAHGKLNVKFVAKPGSIAGGLYGLRLLR